MNKRMLEVCFNFKRRGFKLSSALRGDGSVAVTACKDGHSTLLFVIPKEDAAV